MGFDPTFIGTVQDVNGTAVTVELSESTVTGLSFVRGEAYRIGQVGSFVRIPLGFTNLYGIVSQVGAGAAPDSQSESKPFGNRWARVQLVGEGHHGGKFTRGVSQHPTIDDRVHIVTEADLKAIYGPGDPDDFVRIGALASAESIPALVDINKLVTRHSAVVGTTGSGKSTTVAGLLTALSDRTRYPSARILLLDLHGEYARALGDRSSVFRIAADPKRKEKPLCIPYWALNFTELLAITLGELQGHANAAVADMVLNLKRKYVKETGASGVNERTVTVDTPIPFSIHQLWLDLHKRENLTEVPKPGGASDERVPAYVMMEDGQTPLQVGDAMSVTPPIYRSVKTTGTASERVQWGGEGLGIKAQVAGLGSRLRDPRYSFLFEPGPWLPNADGIPSEDLDTLLAHWIGGAEPITILDLSGIPTAVLSELIGALLRIVYDSLFWSRNLPEGGRERPLLIVLEEAHTYLAKENDGSAAAAVRRIAKEGRKYGVGLTLVSQRPSEIDSTILSQCGTIVALRLSNEIDRGHVTSVASDNLKGLFDMLPILRTGEAIIVGEAVSLPMRTLIDSPPRAKRPDSFDPVVAVRGSIDGDGFDSPGGWNQQPDVSDCAIVLRQWRKQDPQYIHDPPPPKNNTNEPQP